MEYIIGILAFIFILGLIIIIHEGGHFFFARKANILCREYAFGMGPILLKKKKGETLYSLRAFPIGGFCAIAGEELEEDPFKNSKQIRLDIQNNVIKGFYFDIDDESTSKYNLYNIISYDIFDKDETGKLYFEVEKDGETFIYDVDPQAIMYDKKVAYQIAPYNRTLGSKNKRQRAMVMFGGPLMNFILAIVVFLIVGFCTTFPDYSSSQLGEVLTNGASNEVLEQGDIITKLKSGSYELDIDEWNDIATFMSNYKDQRLNGEIEIYYTRNNIENKTATVYPQFVFNTLAFASSVDTSELVIGTITKAEDELIFNSKLQKGDKIVKIDGKDMTSWMDVVKAMESNVNGDVMKFSIIPSGQNDIVTVDVKPYSQETYRLGIGTNSIIYGDSNVEVNYTKVNLGISPTYKFNFMKSVNYGLDKTWSSFKIIFVTLKSLFVSNEIGVGNLSGPVGIFSLATAVANNGFIYVLNLLGMLSVNVGLLNLLPIPALDGGRLVFLGYEAITKKKPSQKVETVMISVTMILLFGLMIYVTFNDILRFFK